ncbi:NACHT domain-containing protein [Nonomuraea sp. NPDC048901]|uniref:NACHT domain-containing protein n=1 Tax=Nonomuraea sp. NPDC048901 TaxID=3155627 RepID=UPI0033E7A585
MFLISEGRENADQWASILGGSVSALAAAVALTGWLRQRAKREGDLGDLDTAEPEAAVVAARVEQLANKVRRVWEAQELRQRLLDPEPLPVSWRTVGPPVSDHWRVIGGEDSPIDLDGSLDDLYWTVRTKLPRTRLVALGEPGSGKTSLVVRFTLACLAAREQAGLAASPIPVILRLSTWRPSEQTLQTWINTRLREDYDFDEPLDMEHLLLILDGLDEMPCPAREEALTRINAAFSARFPIVLTSRTEEYVATIESRRSDVLTAAAAIELQPLNAAAVRDYLTITTKPARLSEWTNVFAELTANPDGELARGLSTPLAISLARVAYAERAADPDHLLSFRTSRQVEAHLLAQLVPALYGDTSTATRVGHHVDDVHRWLSILARHFMRRGISWPDLSDLVSPLVHSLIIGSVTGLSVSAILGLATRPFIGTLVGLMMMLAVWAYTVTTDSAPSQHTPTCRRLLAFCIAPVALFAALLWSLTTLGGQATSPASGIALAASLWCLVLLSGGLIALQLAVLDLGIVIALVNQPDASPQALVLAGLVVTIIVSTLSAAQPRLFIARVLLFFTGHLPWRLNAFLEDGYRRGVFRKVGDLYYFRHDLLREQLANSGGAESP